jgi:hypothetical protein
MLSPLMPRAAITDMIDTGKEISFQGNTRGQEWQEWPAAGTCPAHRSVRASTFIVIHIPSEIATSVAPETSIAPQLRTAPF